MNDMCKDCTLFRAMPQLKMQHCHIGVLQPQQGTRHTLLCPPHPPLAAAVETMCP